MTRARPFFIGGTSSNAGKSWMATAICAWLRDRGVAVAPFKAQNMSNNSYPCRGGGEIGRAQVAQAEACGLDPEPAMNPILLKPNGQGASQVVIDGRMWKTLTAREYYSHAAEMRAIVRRAYDDLAARFEVIVIEGAGSVTELNLREHDVVNLDLVARLGAPWMLVADIERGGVFASIVGTVALLTPPERALLRGFAINRFRGDRALFDDGVGMLEARTGTRCVGVFPHAPDIHLDAEDSLSLVGTARTAAPPGARTAIVRFPRLSNGTDLRLLTWADWIASPPALDYDVVILPGSKNTVADLSWLRASGLANWVLAQHRRGATIVGICGGYQMLGRTVSDPTGVESATPQADGLGLLPVRTTLTREKRTRVVGARTPGGVAFGAYEIHLGETSTDAGAVLPPFAYLDDGTPDGMRDVRVYGTYLHGAFEHAGVCAEVFGLTLPAVRSKSEDYRRLGAWFAEHVRHAGELGLG